MVSSTEKDRINVHKKKVKREKKDKNSVGRGVPITSEEIKAELKAETIAEYKNTQSRSVGKPAKLINEADAKKVQQITEKIMNLHREIQTALSKSLQNAIAIGGLLFEQKTMIEHGEFMKWVKANMSISKHTAQRYMKLYEYRKTLAKKHVETITEAYHLIFNWSTSDEVAEVNDDIDDKGMITYSDPEVKVPTLPKKVTRGGIQKVEVSREFIDDVISGKEIGGGNETHCKFEIEINSNTVASETGDLIKALEPKLKLGGKIILTKK